MAVDNLDDCLKLMISNSIGSRMEASQFAGSFHVRSKEDRNLARLILFVGLTDPSEFVRTICVEGLEEMGCATDVYRISKLIHDNSWIVRCTVLSSLATLSPKYAESFLREALFNDKNPDVRRYAAGGIQDARLIHMIPELEKAAINERHKTALVGILHCLFILTDGSNKKFLDFFCNEQSLMVLRIAVEALLDDVEQHPDIIVKSRPLIESLLDHIRRRHPELSVSVAKLSESLRSIT